MLKQAWLEGKGRYEPDFTEISAVKIKAKRPREEEVVTKKAEKKNIVAVEKDNLTSSKYNSGEIGDGCHFIKFTKNIDIGIAVQSILSTDAFDFEFVNGKLMVLINSNHAFYSKLYSKSTQESKNVLDMMISSLCHLSHINVSTTVKKQDKKMFSRWSEYIEDYLLENER